MVGGGRLGWSTHALLGRNASTRARAATAGRPRLFYVDGLTFKHKECDLKVDAPDAKDKKSNVVRISQGGRPFKVQSVLHPPHKWISAIEGLTRSGSKGVQRSASLLSHSSAASSPARGSGGVQGATPKRSESLPRKDDSRSSLSTGQQVSAHL